MTIEKVRIDGLDVSRLIVGGNPFSGFSHQTPEQDREMACYYTAARIKQTLRQAEELGINTFVGRADRHIRRVLLEYWNEGGTIQWFAQTCPEYTPISRSVAAAIDGGARACFIHGGQMDYLLAQGQVDQVPAAIARIKEAGLAAGLAGHTPRVFEWAEDNLDVDFYMCAYYNPTRRDERAEHDPSAQETFASRDRDAMVHAIQRLSKPTIHYKVMAAGRNDPRRAFEFVGQYLRPQDAVCVGVYTKHRPQMLEQNLQLLQDVL